MVYSVYGSRAIRAGLTKLLLRGRHKAHIISVMGRKECYSRIVER